MFDLFKRAKKKSPSNPSHRQLIVKEIIHETSDAISIVFDVPEKEPMPYEPGQFLTIIASINGKEVRRSYSLCSSHFLQEPHTITVKKVAQGIMSSHLLDNLKPGDNLEVLLPKGRFVLNYESTRHTRHVVFFAGGSGITPVIAILKSLLVKEPQSTASLIYGNKDENSIIFRKSLDKLKKIYGDRFSLIHVLETPNSDITPYNGILTHEMLNTISQNIDNWNAPNTLYLICGPAGMMKVINIFLESHHIPSTHILSESFTSKSHEETSPSTVATTTHDKIQRQVTIHYDGEVHHITVKPSIPILTAALDAGIDLPFSCQSGLCTACRGKLLSGKMHMEEQEGLSQQEQDEGYVLTCVGHPLSDDVIIEID